MARMIDENMVEQAALAWLAELGYAVLRGPDLDPEGTNPERGSYQNVFLRRRLEKALFRLNPGVDSDQIDLAIDGVVRAASTNLFEENHRIHGLLTEGIRLDAVLDDGRPDSAHVRLLDFASPENNDWLAVNQFTVTRHHVRRRADIVVFVNGLPLAVMELKNPADSSAFLDNAVLQLKNYQHDIPDLFRPNVFQIVSDGSCSRLGSLTADVERFMAWRTEDGKGVLPKGNLELETLLRGVFAPRHFLNLLRHFIFFKDEAKIIAGYHQYHAVLKAVDSTRIAVLASPRRKNARKAGVIWHTQGSGKSFLMLFYTALIRRDAELGSPTLVFLTDRAELDDQLFKTFKQGVSLLGIEPEQADSRVALRKWLSERQSGGIIFTTLQKFFPEDGSAVHPLLSDRTNIIVVADEAHRSHYGVQAHVRVADGKLTYGLAKYFRDALPNATVIGFTGTPVEKDDKNTPATFGDYIDVYDISRAVEDGATVPIYYESRIPRVELDSRHRLKIDDDVAAITEDDAPMAVDKLQKKWSRIETLVGAPARQAMLAKDLVEHFENRIAAVTGKGMVVCMSRRICVELYDAIVKLRPDWHDKRPNKGKIKVVMTAGPSDPPAWRIHSGTNASRERMAERFKNPDDPLMLVLVRDMWLTGFDAPSMHTLYIDKPMQGHNLMQAIARVNRVYKGKPNGLVVDYIGLAQDLKKALSHYSRSDQKQVGIDEREAENALRDCYDVVHTMFHGFEGLDHLNGTDQERLRLLGLAVDWISAMRHHDVAAVKSEKAKRKAERRYDDAVAALTTAFALAPSGDYAQSIREQVGFFQAVRQALRKPVPGASTINPARELAMRQIVSRAVISTEIMDILKAVGVRQKFSLFSASFLDEVARLPQKNLALEALRKLVDGAIQAHARTSIVEQRRFSERLEDALRRYYNNSLSTAEIIDELIRMAKDIEAARKAGDAEGFNEDERSFYTALAENESAVQAMGDAKLRLIAHELLESLRRNRPVDWTSREQSRARMRVLVRRILDKYHYPPDLCDEAIRTVLQQAEAVLAALSDDPAS